MRLKSTGIVLGGLLVGCASAPPMPVLYPNSHMQSVGQVQAEQDVAACKQLAHSSGVAENKDSEMGKKAVGGAAVGGAAAGAWGNPSAVAADGRTVFASMFFSECVD